MVIQVFSRWIEAMDVRILINANLCYLPRYKFHIHSFSRSKCGSVGSTPVSHTYTYSHLSASYSRDLLLPDHSNDAAIQAIGKKAEELCIQPGPDVPVPGAAVSLQHMVPSKSGAAPHFVKTPPTLTGQFICNDQCLYYMTYKICSCTVAAAVVFVNN